MGKITRRAFIAQTATMAGVASALATDVHAHPQPTTAAMDTMDKRRETLEVLLKILPRRRAELNGRINAYDKSWEDWLERTGELPPDFDAMPSTPFLVDPLEGVQTPSNGSKSASKFARNLSSGFLENCRPSLTTFAV
jgi:3',5'-cyclic AMP phosphodiesterase CpdA